MSENVVFLAKIYTLPSPTNPLSDRIAKKKK